MVKAARTLPETGAMVAAASNPILSVGQKGETMLLVDQVASRLNMGNGRTEAS